MEEDGSRNRNPNLLTNLALLRNTLVAALSNQFPDQSLPQIHERLHSHPAQCLALLSS